MFSYNIFEYELDVMTWYIPLNTVLSVVIQIQLSIKMIAEIA